MTTDTRNDRSPGWRVFTWLTSGLAAAAALALLYSAYCAFTWEKFALFDYGVYTNMIWNSGHGAPFRVLVDVSYLRTHLSFTLALLGYLYRLWDHPFLLSLVQHVALFGGTLFLVAAGRRQGVPGPALAALAFFFTGYIFTQRAMLSEFHGVAMYYLLVPWLYFALRHARRWAVIPLILLLGIREEAFLFLLPLLIHRAVCDRWKPGYLLAAIAIGYGIFAMTWLFPAINGMSLIERRHESLSAARLLGTWDDRGTTLRLHALALTFLPMLPFLRRGASAVWLYPSVALLSCMASGYWRQHGLLNHYAPPVLTTLAIGLLEGMTRAGTAVAPQGDRLPLRASALVALTLAVHFLLGHAPLGGDNATHYLRPHPAGEDMRRAVRRLPKDGLLVTDTRLSAFSANRRDLLTWDRFKPDQHTADVILDRPYKIPKRLDGALMTGLSNGTYGVLLQRPGCVILRRGGDTNGNPRFLRYLRDGGGEVVTVCTLHHGGENRYDFRTGWVRYWEGNGSRGPINLSYGDTVPLKSGPHTAWIRYRAQAPRRAVRNSWGWFSVHRPGEAAALAEAQVDPAPTPRGRYRVQRLDFTLDQPGPIEFRATGADAALWIDRAWLLPADPTLPMEEILAALDAR